MDVLSLALRQQGAIEGKQICDVILTSVLAFMIMSIEVI